LTARSCKKWQRSLTWSRSFDLPLVHRRQSRICLVQAFRNMAVRKTESRSNFSHTPRYKNSIRSGPTPMELFATEGAVEPRYLGSWLYGARIDESRRNARQGLWLNAKSELLQTCW
jgi:hypothetical protein